MCSFLSRFPPLLDLFLDPFEQNLLLKALRDGVLTEAETSFFLLFPLLDERLSQL